MIIKLKVIVFFDEEKRKMDVTRIIMDQNEIRVIVRRNFEMVSHVKGYDMCKTLWSPLIGEFLSCESEPDNPMDKYAVCVKKENKIVRHLPLGKSGKFAKTIFYFLRAEELSSCKIVVTGKPVNLGDDEGMQVSCKSIFTGIEKCINILKQHLYTC